MLPKVIPLLKKKLPGSYQEAASRRDMYGLLPKAKVYTEIAEILTSLWPVIVCVTAFGEIIQYPAEIIVLS